MRYTIEFSDTALFDIERHRKAGDVTVLRKIDKLLKELLEHPASGTGQPKLLKHNFAGLYSRRINQKHRMIYSINNEIITVHVLSLWGHYGDK
jgi:toxin YoeB